MLKIQIQKRMQTAYSVCSSALQAYTSTRQQLVKAKNKNENKKRPKTRTICVQLCWCVCNGANGNVGSNKRALQMSAT